MAATANLSAVAVWIRLPGLPIEYYEPSMLRDIGLAIGSVLRVDTQTATEPKGRFARLCVQVNFDKLIVKLVKIGGIHQLVQYECINALCFTCGRVGHRTEGCPYNTQKLNDEIEAASSQRAGKEHKESDKGDFGPWILVTQKRKPKNHPVKEIKSLAHLGMLSQNSSQPSHVLSPSTGPVTSGLRSNKEKHTLSELTGDNGMRADRTMSNQSLDMCTTKQRA